jgi:hypothetical protein
VILDTLLSVMLARRCISGARSGLSLTGSGQPVDGLASWVGLSEDDAHVFPIYGWLNVWWHDEPMEGDPSGTSADTA